MSNARNKIKSASELRDFVLESLQDLRDGKMDLPTAATIGKLADSTINIVRTEMEFSKLTGQDASIPFLKESVIEGRLEDRSSKKLGYDK